MTEKYIAAALAVRQICDAIQTGEPPNTDLRVLLEPSLLQPAVDIYFRTMELEARQEALRMFRDPGTSTPPSRNTPLSPPEFDHLVEVLRQSLTHEQAAALAAKLHSKDTHE